MSDRTWVLRINCTDFIRNWPQYICFKKIYFNGNSLSSEICPFFIQWMIRIVEKDCKTENRKDEEWDKNGKGDATSNGDSSELFLRFSDLTFEVFTIWTAFGNPIHRFWGSRWTHRFWGLLGWTHNFWFLSLTSAWFCCRCLSSVSTVKEARKPSTAATCLIRTKQPHFSSVWPVWQDFGYWFDFTRYSASFVKNSDDAPKWRDFEFVLCFRV